MTSLYFNYFPVSSSVHILLGVESESEVKALQFEGIRSKGIEPIVFDREDVNDFAKVVYRSKEVLRDLNRPLLGVVVNLLDDPKQSSSSATAISKGVGIKSVDAAYKSYVKPFLRAVEACTEVMLEQNSQSGRVVMLYPSSFNEKQNGVRTIVGKMLDQTAHELRHSFHSNRRNFSVSTVAASVNVNTKISSSNLYPKQMWAMENDHASDDANKDIGNNNINSDIESTLYALQHSLLSSTPQSAYNKGNMLVHLRDIISKKGSMKASTIIDSISIPVFQMLLFVAGDKEGNIKVPRFIYTLLTEEFS